MQEAGSQQGLILQGVRYLTPLACLPPPAAGLPSTNIL
jgi:hypothetical protein